MEGLEHRVRETMEQYHMLEPGDRVIAAVSGGADSVCLLALLCAWREPRGISIRALHVHHGLRGEEADRDADFVRSLCEGLHVPCHILKVDVRGLAAEKGMSEEEAGRFLRYEALEKEALDWEGEDRASEARSGQDGDWADGGFGGRRLGGWRVRRTEESGRWRIRQMEVRRMEVRQMEVTAAQQSPVP
ncbi:MAG: ATP-binding protein [Enterocloster bolteae]